MNKQQIIKIMMDLLTEALEDEGAEDIAITPLSPLLGENAIIASLGLVSLVADIELSIAEESGNDELNIVNEDALSRSKSPFIHLEALSEYVLELLENLKNGK